ncbi:MAG: hypothetical protein L6R35_007474 [Caloplaca aegaea]|nr:MAG: hypothetical protein L6R35_007474 [Caloplaca aegaea]
MDCWRNDANSNYVNMTHWGHTPCTPSPSNSDKTLPCCNRGDECLSDNICRFTTRDAKRSGYYVASCTDEDLQDSACSQTCSNQPQSDAVYDPTTSFWQCCGENSDGKVDCVYPKGRTFRAPAPEALSRFCALSSSATSQATETSTLSTFSGPSSATSSTNAKPSPTPERASSLPTPPPAAASTSSELELALALF